MNQKNNNILGVGYYGVNDPEISKLYLNALLTSQKRWDYAQELKRDTMSNLYNLEVDPKSEEVLRGFLDQKVGEIEQYVSDNFAGDWGRSVDYLKEVLPKLNAINGAAKLAYQQYIDNYKIYKQLEAQNKLTGTYSIDENGEMTFTPVSFDDLYREPYLKLNQDTIELDLNANTKSPIVRWDPTNIVNKAINAFNNKIKANTYFSIGKIAKGVNEEFIKKHKNMTRGMSPDQFDDYVRNDDNGVDYINKLAIEVLSDPVAYNEFQGNIELVKEFLINKISTGLYKQQTGDINVISKYNDTEIPNNPSEGFPETSMGVTNEVLTNDDLKKMAKNFTNVNSIMTPFNFVIGKNIIKSNLDIIKKHIENSKIEVSYNIMGLPVEKEIPLEDGKAKLNSSIYGDNFKIYTGLMDQFKIISFEDDYIVVDEKKFNKFYNYIEDKISTIQIPKASILTDEAKNKVIKFIGNSDMGNINPEKITAVSFNFKDPSPNILVTYKKDTKTFNTEVPIEIMPIANIYNVGHSILQTMVFKNVLKDTTIYDSESGIGIEIGGMPVKQIILEEYDPNTLNPIFKVLYDDNTKVKLGGEFILKEVGEYIANLLGSSIEE